MSRMMRLSDLGRIVTGNTPKTSDFRNYNSKDICFVKPSDIPVDCIGRLRESEFYISEFARDKARMLPKGSVLLTCIGIIGKVAVNEIECAFNQQINAIIPDCDKCDCIYLAYALSAKKDYLQALANAPVVPIINKTQFSAFQIPVPSLSVQSNIVKRIEIIDYLISLRQRQAKKLDELVKARFVEMFGERKYGEKPLSDVCKLITDGTHQPPQFVDAGIPFLLVSNLVHNEITYDTEKFISKESYQELIKRTPVEIGDILLSIVGSYGHAGVVRTDKPFCFQRHIAYIKPDFSKLNSEFLHQALLSDAVKYQMEKRVKGIAQKTLNLSELKKIIVPIPPLPLQTEFAHFVHEIDREKERIQKSAALLETLKRSLMQQYFG